MVQTLPIKLTLAAAAFVLLCPLVTFSQKRIIGDIPEQRLSQVWRGGGGSDHPVPSCNMLKELVYHIFYCRAGLR